MENAIIMAAGFGSRMMLLTKTKPKPLIKVGGTPMIETVIRGLRCRNIDGIYIVTGYLGEQFLYLENKYENVRCIPNKDFDSMNNISSVYAARHILDQGNCFICEADLFIRDQDLFMVQLKESCYFGKMVSGLSEDWVFEQDEDGFITRVGKRGINCYNMVGISYFLESDAKVLKEVIEEIYCREDCTDLFWDDAVNMNLDRLKLKVHPVLEGQLEEIDTVEELNLVNSSLNEKTFRF